MNGNLCHKTLNVYCRKDLYKQSLYICIVFPSFFIRLASFVLLINDIFEVLASFITDVISLYLQGCKIAPTLFGMYAAVMLYLAFKDINPCYSIKVRFRYDGDLFDHRRLK